MVERLENARTWLTRLIVSLVLLAALSKDVVFDLAGAWASTGANSAFYQAIYIIGLILIYAALEGLTGLAIDKFRFVRRLLMGHEDIEGYWLDVVYQSDKIIAGGLIVIAYEDRSYKISGRDFDENGALSAWFSSEISHFEQGRYRFTYRSMRPRPARDGTGHGEHQFSGSGYKRFVQYDGHYFEARGTRRFYVHGERLSDFVKSRKMSLREAMKPNNIPPLVDAFIDARRAALPLAPVVAPETLSN